MGRIRILPDIVANKIAAGEVVERPASVVKELLENSLDAGASEIRIDTENAGRRLIRIADNGAGMLRDDAMLAFERHATSKLSDVKDLLSIATLGFRGEALPSIASVSRLLLETRTAGEETGSVVEIAGGKMLRCDELARPVGTTIAVRDLFFNVPARKKFLRSDQTELAHIGSLVTHYSLAHPEKRFELYHEGRELLHATPVATRKERAFQVFGSETMADLITLGVRRRDLHLTPAYTPAEASASGGAAASGETTEFRLEGLVSGPHVQKLNRNSIFLFVNGRLIRDKLLLHAIAASFHNLMPPGCYPFALLFLGCDAGEVDVNVHPAKTEVRFRHSSWVHDFVRDAIREALMEQRPVSAMPVRPESSRPLEQEPAHAAPWPLRPPATPQEAATLPFSEWTQARERESFQTFGQTGGDASGEIAGEHRVEGFGQRETAADLPEILLTVPAWPTPGVSPREGAAWPAIASRRVPDTHGALDQLPAEWEPAGNLAMLPDLRPMGQLHESFIIAAGRDGLWIIDQHVAHERVLFEQVLRQRAAGRVEIQRLLMPMVLELSAGQEFEYARIADELNASGFETEPFGRRTIAVKAAPAGLTGADAEKVIFEILETAEKELRAASVDEIRRGVAATIACRAAIKINTKLEPAKMGWLLQALAACQYPMTCPHGRPIALRYATKEILKSFHRI